MSDTAKGVLAFVTLIAVSWWIVLADERACHGQEAYCDYLDDTEFTPQ